jgi:opacity protein-like surface antigen
MRTHLPATRWTRLGALAGLLAGLGAPVEAADGDQVRDYFVLRIGPAYLTDPNRSSDVELENPALENVIGGAVGANLTRHLGVELAVDYMETALIQPGTGQKIGEYGFWSILGQARLRYPTWQGKLVPYLVTGAGIGIGEMNDRNFANAGINGRPAIPLNGPMDTTFVGTFGAGVEYFVTDNIAVGFEAKHYFLTGLDLEFAGRKTGISTDSIAATVSARVFLDPPPEGRRRGSPAAEADG